MILGYCQPFINYEQNGCDYELPAREANRGIKQLVHVRPCVCLSYQFMIEE